MRRGFRRALPAVALLAAAVLGPVPVDANRPVAASPVKAAPVAARSVAAGARPNIVLILMDDFSTELLATMPNAQKMRREGAAYRNAFVVDSLCCPSRAALFTGQTPHQTHVLTNTVNDPLHPVGGYRAFAAYGNLKRSFNVALRQHGYTTGFIGKYLNQYEARNVDGQLIPPPRPPGWSDFRAILGGGYAEWGFRSTYVNADGALGLKLESKPPSYASVLDRDRHYATNVMADRAVGFVDRHSDDDRPYFLEISTYGPHASLGSAYSGDPAFPPAFADRPGTVYEHGNCGLLRCGQLGVDDLPGYDDPRADNAPTYLRRDGSTRPAPAWRTNPISLTKADAVRNLRNRARMVQSVDRLIRRVRAAVGPNTYVFLTSDNGFHLGQHQLNGGKGAPYDSDTRVPLLVVGPGVAPGPRAQFVSNIDLAPTFEGLVGQTSPSYRAGRSFVSSLHRPSAPGARYAFFEHTWSQSRPGEVDGDKRTGGTMDVIPSYVAVRGARGLLVRVDLDNSWSGHRYAWELYRYDVPWEDRNVFAGDHRKPWARDLMRRLRLFDHCTPDECREAAR
ncbi:MAG TPA: sulfatase-like hydrolase/transferase [Nocardioides sp.]